MSSIFDQRGLFSFDHTIYWPKKYERVVEYLKNGTGDRENPQSLYKYNVEAIVLAACFGVREKYAIDFSGDTSEINLSTFNSQGLGIYLYLVPMLSEEVPNLDYFRNKEGEDKAISIFQKYAAGGLELLNEKLVTRSLESPYLFVQDLVANRQDGVRDLDMDIF
jgi:dnd system-associated protein 4